MDDRFYSLPWYTSYWWVLGVFAVLSVLFHVVLVRLPLSSIAWKRVDYIWLAMAFTGILASVGGVRTLVAKNLLAAAESRVIFELDQVERAAVFGTSIAVCRVFTRSAASLPPEQMEQLQRDFDAQCAWFKALTPKLQAFSTTHSVPIDLEKLVGPPPSGGDRWAVETVIGAVAAYNAALVRVESLKHESKSNLLELLQVLGPSLLAAALALRITKVTGEIRLERSKASREA
ncbi:MAG: hypothetical protein V4864_02120 [Pseudomonadota bacterium]